MKECGFDVIAGHSVTGPCTAFFGRLVNEDCSARWGDRVSAEVEDCTGEAVMGRDSWVRLPR